MGKNYSNFKIGLGETFLDSRQYIYPCNSVHIIKHKTKKSDVTLYLRNERAQRVDFGICHKQNIGEEPGQVKFGVDPDEAPGDPKNWSKNWFLSSAKHIRVPRGLIFGYVVGLKLALNTYLVNIRIGPNEAPQGPRR